MIEREAKRNQMLSALADHALIKAAVIFDRHGNVRAQVGSSRVVGTTDRFTDGSLDRGNNLPKENVYLVGVGKEFLLAVFNDKADFESIKSDIHTLIDDLEL
ncbi:MAG: hypothetical protein ACQEVA_18125 [Myxococcota bacterium]